jgi:hypothetical protein
MEYPREEAIAASEQVMANGMPFLAIEVLQEHFSEPDLVEALEIRGMASETSQEADWWFTAARRYALDIPPRAISPADSASIGAAVRRMEQRLMKPEPGPGWEDDPPLADELDRVAAEIGYSNDR